MAINYKLVIERDEDGNGYIGSTLEMPLVMGGGDSIDLCAKDVLEATTMSIATMLEHNERPPVPASENKRTEQLNIRLTSSEKYQLEAAARQAGFRSVSDFVRASALSKAS